jgi:hypothetical protein
MAFLTLPGRNLRYPSESRVPIHPAIQPRANIATAIAQALPELLKQLDPVERAKQDALLAHYNYLKSHPSGTKPMTAYQQAMLDLATQKAGVAQQKQHFNNTFLAPFYRAARGWKGPDKPAKAPLVRPAGSPPPTGASVALPITDPDYQSSNYIGLGDQPASSSSAPSLSLSPEDYQDLQLYPLGGIDTDNIPT